MNILFIRVIEVGCQCREVGAVYRQWVKLGYQEGLATIEGQH